MTLVTGGAARAGGHGPDEAEHRGNPLADAIRAAALAVGANRDDRGRSRCRGCDRDPVAAAEVRAPGLDRRRWRRSRRTLAGQRDRRRLRETFATASAPTGAATRRLVGLRGRALQLSDHVYGACLRSPGSYKVIQNGSD